MKQDKRPVFISISPFTFHFPLTALASITHRITGVLLFLGFGYFLYLLSMALQDEAGFEQVRSMLGQPLHQVLLFLCLSALSYHTALGIKHIFLDFHIGDSLRGSQIATAIAVVAFGVLASLSAVWIWI